MDLMEAREELNRIDDALAALFLHRLAVVEEIAKYKAAHGLQVRQPGREKEIITRLCRQAEEKYRADLTALYRKVFQISRAMQARPGAGG